MADAVGLDRGKFDACLPGGVVFNDVQAETALGMARGNSAPILDFGGVVREGSPPHDQLAATVRQLLAIAPTVPPASSAASPAPSASASP